MKAGTTAVDEAGTIQLAVRQLGDAVHPWIAPQPFCLDGSVRTLDPLYALLVDEVPGGRNGAAGVSQMVKAPAHVDILDLLIVVDRFALENHPDGKTTPDRLLGLVSASWGVEDAGRVSGLVVQLQGFTKRAEELLGLAPVTVHLEFDCPRCGAGWCRRPSKSGEWVRVRTLSVSERGAQCANCSASWSTQEFGFLAALLGCEPVLA